MLQALGSTLVELAGSKKAILLLATVVAAITAKVGWHVDAATIDRYLELAGAFIVAQGIADHGKGAEEERTRQKLAGLPTSGGASGGQVIQNITGPTGGVEQNIPPSTTIAKVATVGMLIFMFAGCGIFSGTKATTIKNDVVDCTTGELVKLEAVAAAFVPLLINGTLTWATLEDAAFNAGVGIGTCLLADINNAMPPPTVGLEPQGIAAISDLKKRLGVAKIHTRHGDF